jgi:hypothetical protein
MSNNTEQDLKVMYCPNCNIPEDTATINTRKNSTMVIVKSHAGPMNFQGFQFYSVICFKCKNLTLIAIDPKNENYFRYVETNKVTETDITVASMSARALNQPEVCKRLETFFEK